MKKHPKGFNGAAADAFANDAGGTRYRAAPSGSREGGEVANAPVAPPLTAEIASGGEAASRFIKRTYFNTQQTARNRITLRNYGDGIAEVGWSFVSAINPTKAIRGESADREGNEDRAARRAKSRLRQLVLSANLTHLLTLTYRENVTDFYRAEDDLIRFIRKVRREHPNWLYVAVAERQERGAWHWHLAVRGYQDVETIRRLWREVVDKGNIDVSAPKGSRKDQRLYLVRYLGKYLVKEFVLGDRKLNKHRFRAARNIQVPIEHFDLPPAFGHKVKEVALQKLLEASGSVGHVWDGDGTFAGWAGSWK